MIELPTHGAGRVRPYSVCRHLLMALCLVVLASPAVAAEILQQVPRDALGFFVVRNLARTDARVAKLLADAQIMLPGPMTMLQTVTGLGAGLDSSRDALLVVLPSENETRPFLLSIWLPVKSFDSLVRSLDGDPSREVVAITVAGEDLLAVQHENWAVLADPDQRDRLESLHKQPVSPPRQVADWQTWIETNDATLVVLPAGMKTAWDWVQQETAAAEESNPTVQSTQAPNNWSAARDAMRTAFAAMPAASRWASQAEGIACGLRMDDDGNTVAGVRLTFDENALPAESNARATPPLLYNGGDFVFDGFGTATKEWAVPAVAPYVRSTANDLAAQFGITLPEEELAVFRGVIEEAVAGVEAFSVLTRPGEKADGVFTNSFVAVRVKSSQDFIAKVRRAMEIWNKMLKESEGGVKLAFETKETKIAERPGIEYSIDMGEAIGEPLLPEARKSQEMLFGPGGRFRMQYVAGDDHTVLLAAATEAQVAKVIPLMDGDASATANDASTIKGANALLEKGPDWQMYFSPAGYFAWMARQMQAIVGDVVGGPLVKEFPDTPPVGAAGGRRGSLVWAEIAVPAETLKAAGKYAHGN